MRARDRQRRPHAELWPREAAPSSAQIQAALASAGGHAILAPAEAGGAPEASRWQILVLLRSSVLLRFRVLLRF